MNTVNLEQVDITHFNKNVYKFSMHFPAESSKLSLHGLTADSFFYIGTAYLYKDNRSRSDDIFAHYWFGLSAKYNSSLPYYEIGRLFFSRRIYTLLPDYEALQWFKRAEYTGNNNARFFLGLMYSRGLGTFVDMSKASNYFRLGYEGGDKRCLYLLKSIAL